MSDADALEQFQAVTGVDASTSKFYLDAAKGDLNAAMTTYYESASTTDVGASQSGSSDRPVSSGSSVQTLAPSSSSSDQSAASRKAKLQTSRGAINTMEGLRQSEEQENDDDKPAEFYTGGEKSGLGVIDPTNKKGGGRTRDLIQEILKKASRGEQPEDSEETPGSTFRGSGYTLGGDEEESRKIEDPNAAFKSSMASVPPRVSRVLKLWKNGFSVDEGTLYRYDDPANKDYLEAINNGRAPLALLNVEYGQPVDVNVEKKTDEDFKAPPKVFKPFEGSGHRLGSEIPPSQDATAPLPAAPSASTSTSSAGLSIEVDESKPVTSLQIRLASGGRLIARFNTTHTVAEVYDALDRSAPDDTRPYTLLTPFPRREYARDGTTLEAASLMKGVLQQKYN